MINHGTASTSIRSDGLTLEESRQAMCLRQASVGKHT